MPEIDSFSTRNTLLLAELSKALDISLLAKELGKSESDSGNIFYSVGSFESELLKRRIHAGVKVFKNQTNNSGGSYFRMSMANLLLLQEMCPEIDCYMPRFFGGIFSEEFKNYLGIVMEDYSEGGAKLVWEERLSRNSDLPICMRPMMETPDDDCAYFCSVESRPGLKLMDLNQPLPWKSNLMRQYYRLCSEVGEGIAKKIPDYTRHTITLNKPLEKIVL